MPGSVTYCVRLYRRGQRDTRDVVPDRPFATYYDAERWARAKMADAKYTGYAIDKVIGTAHGSMVIPYGGYAL